MQGNARRLLDKRWDGNTRLGQLSKLGLAPVLWCMIFVLLVMYVHSVIMGKNYAPSIWDKNSKCIFPIFLIWGLLLENYFAWTLNLIPVIFHFGYSFKSTKVDRRHWPTCMVGRVLSKFWFNFLL